MDSRNSEASRVERVLETQGRTISWLAGQIDTPITTTWRYLKGERKAPAEFRAAAAKALGVPEDMLFGEPQAKAS